MPLKPLRIAQDASQPVPFTYADGILQIACAPLPPVSPRYSDRSLP
jgi:hypothetical protein